MYEKYFRSTVIDGFLYIIYIYIFFSLFFLHAKFGKQILRSKNYSSEIKEVFGS